jgi:hypothetical protein
MMAIIYAGTLAKAAASGGQLHGTLIGFPSAPFTAPSQSPDPVGFWPASNPRSGIRVSSTARLSTLSGKDEARVRTLQSAIRFENFIFGSIMRMMKGRQVVEVKEGWINHRKE